MIFYLNPVRFSVVHSDTDSGWFRIGFKTGAGQDRQRRIFSEGRIFLREQTEEKLTATIRFDDLNMLAESAQSATLPQPLIHAQVFTTETPGKDVLSSSVLRTVR